MRKTSSILIAAVIGLVCLGIVMLASSSSVKGYSTFDDPYYYLKRQIVWLAVSIVAGFIVARFDYHLYQKIAMPIGILAVILLVLVFVPGIGVKVGGSYRWIGLLGRRVQPSEYAKIASIIVLATWMSSIGQKTRNLLEGLICPMLWIGLMCGLLIIEPDFGTTLLVGVVGMLLLFAAGSRLSYLSVTALLGFSAFIFFVVHDAVRMSRIMAFVNPSKYPVTAYHLIQSKQAFMLGGLSGVGLGESMQKQLYLPEPHTDFIFAIIGEELGVYMTIAVVLVFLTILVCGILISINATDLFGRLLAFGITMMLVMQASINIGVVTGCLPTKGIALPFISYGGSSLLASIACVCILLNIALHCGKQTGHVHTRKIKDNVHRL